MAVASLFPRTIDPSAGYPNYNIEPDDFRPLDIATLRDENSDGLLDRLDAALGFTPVITRKADRSTTITVPAVPGRIYYFEKADAPSGPFSGIGNALAKPGDISVSFTDGSTFPDYVTERFYRVVVNDP